MIYQIPRTLINCYLHWEPPEKMKSDSFKKRLVAPGWMRRYASSGRFGIPKSSRICGVCCDQHRGLVARSAYCQVTPALRALLASL